MKNSNSALNNWLDNNTGMYGRPLSYQERIEDCQRARGEQMAPHRKRFVYKFYYNQECDEGSGAWTYIGEFEVDNQEELWELDDQLRKKYRSDTKYNKIKTLW